MRSSLATHAKRPHTQMRAQMRASRARAGAHIRTLTWARMHRFYTQGRLDVTVGGHETRNEMCLNYLIYYPKINLGSCFAKADWEGTIKSFAKLLVPRRPLPLPIGLGAETLWHGRCKTRALPRTRWRPHGTTSLINWSGRTCGTPRRRARSRRSFHRSASPVCVRVPACLRALSCCLRYTTGRSRWCSYVRYVRRPALRD